MFLCCNQCGMKYEGIAEAGMPCVKCVHGIIVNLPDVIADMAKQWDGARWLCERLYVAARC